jgi:hypothetical protein
MRVNRVMFSIGVDEPETKRQVAKTRARGRKEKNASTLLHGGFSLGLFFDLEDGSDKFLTKRQLTFNGLHGVISLKTRLFITAAVRTSNPTHNFNRLVAV